MKQFEQLYLEHKQDIYNYLLSLTHNPALSEDLLSETFFQAICSVRSFKGNSSIKTWLFGIARNLWLQNLRKDKPNIEYSELLDSYVADGVFDSFITKQISARVAELLAMKDTRTQEITRMRICGVSYHEIAEKMGVSENSARVIDFRVKKWLRNVLEKEGLI